jgi:gas vesicle protein
MSDNENNGSSGLGWFVAGLGLGALLGVLYAPKSGAETRAELVAGARDGQEYIKRKTYEIRNQAGELVEVGKQQFDEYYAKGREQFDDYVNAGREYYAKGREQLNDVVERGKVAAVDQVNRVQAAVEAGKEAYRTTAATGSSTGTDGD